MPQEMDEDSSGGEGYSESIWTEMVHSLTPNGGASLTQLNELSSARYGELIDEYRKDFPLQQIEAIVDALKASVDCARRYQDGLSGGGSEAHCPVDVQGVRGPTREYLQDIQNPPADSNAL